MKAVVRDVMTTDPVSARKTSSFKELAARLLEFRVSAFPVLDDDGKVIGVVSEADMLAKESLDGGRDATRGMITRILHRKELKKAGGTTAGDLITSPAVTVAPDDTVEHAARLMYTLQVKRLPVVDPGGKLVGIISRTDVLAVFDRPDEEIRQEITDNVILNDFLEDPGKFSVTVQAGVVTLEGSPETAALGHDIVRKIRHVQGVVAVRDRLSYPDTYPIVARPLF
jgi:CBS-domain-containing membrane protein